MKLKNRKRKALTAEFVDPYPVRKVKILESYYYQGGKWHKLKRVVKS